MDIHLITLNTTSERRDKALKELAKLPELNVIVHENARHPTTPWKGCIDSHIKVYKYAIVNNLDYIWICEDNLYTSVTDMSKVNKVIEYAETYNNWQVIFTGGYILRPWDYCVKTNKEGLYETRHNNHGTVSYLIHKSLFTKIVDIYDTVGINEHFDIFLSKYTTFIYKPMIFYHAHNIASNINSHSDVWRYVWFHPLVAKVNEKMFFQKTYLNIAIIILTVIAIVIGVYSVKY